MGFSISWFAVPEAAAQKAFDRLGLSPTGATEEIPESLISAAKLDTGWRVLWYNEYECPFLGPKELAELSNEHDVLRCLVEEHVMASSSELWSRGRRKWSISHEGENGPKGLSIDGEVPDSFSSIRAEMERTQSAAGGDQADVDYIFEIPLKVAQSVVGFKHDEKCSHMHGERFVVLSKQSSKKGFMRKLFG
jgi:hypothetical protein